MSPVNHPLAKVLVFSGTVLALGATLTPADEPSEPASKDHVLFIGLNLFVRRNDASNPVVGADDNSVQIVENGERARLRLTDVAQFQTDVLPKVSKVSVAIEGLQGDRCYGPNTDPQKKAEREQLILQSAQELAEAVAAHELSQAQEANRVASASGGATFGPQQGGGTPPPSENAAIQKYGQAFMPMYSSRADGKGLNFDDSKVDAYRVGFTLSAPENVEDAYGVLRLIIRDPVRTGSRTQVIKFMRLPDIGPKPRKVEFLALGFPPGFTVESEELHVYTDGHELATNLAKDRVQLSVDDVHQFFILQRLTDHALVNAPVEIIPALLENDLRDYVPAEQMNRGVTVTVDATGHVTDVKLEHVDWNGPDSYIESALRKTRFFPAISHGKPFPGTGRFVLSEFLP